MAGTGEILRKSRNRLNLTQPAASFVVGEAGNGRIQFIDDISKPAVGMEIEVAWSRAGFNRGKRWIVWDQLSRSQIYAYNL